MEGTPDEVEYAILFVHNMLKGVDPKEDFYTLTITLFARKVKQLKKGERLDLPDLKKYQRHMQGVNTFWNEETTNWKCSEVENSTKYKLRFKRLNSGEKK